MDILDFLSTLHWISFSLVFSVASMEISSSNDMMEEKVNADDSHLRNIGIIKRSGQVLEDNFNSLPFLENKNNTGLAFFEKCFGVYGCFRIDQPFLTLARPINVFPQDPKDISPKLCLYTRSNPTDCQILRIGFPEDVTESNFVVGDAVKLVTHGYLESGEKRWLKRIVSEYLVYDRVNVVVIDWLSGSAPPYTQACANIRLIGAIVGKFVIDLEDYFGIPPAHVHHIGHSLGAQMGAYIGDYLKERGRLLGRITGMDPAEPYFEGTDPLVRLDPTDAALVDIIHSDGGPIITGGLGMYQPVGHFDYYPNGGIKMPGCGTGFVDAVAIEEGNVPYGIRRAIGCNHIRAYEYFTESINSMCPFMAIECSSWEEYWIGKCWECGEDWSKCNRMGAHADSYLNYSRPTEQHKTMYLITGDRSPFCRFHMRVTVYMSLISEAQEHGGDIGIFHITFHGELGVSERIQLNPEEIFFEPGNEYTYIIGVPDLGHLEFATLEWNYITAYYSPLSWRLLSPPSVYVNRIHIDSIEMQERYEFCGMNLSFKSGTIRRLEWQPNCPEKLPNPGASILGSIINFEVENTINSNIDSLNSGLNSLGNGQLINNFASSTFQAAQDFMQVATRRISLGGSNNKRNSRVNRMKRRRHRRSLTKKATIRNRRYKRYSLK